MNLLTAIAADGMTPPREIVSGRWMRFPGIGKGKSNRAGWCRLITPTLAIYGDWSSGLTKTWQDDAHRDDERTRKLLQEARIREQEFRRQQQERQKSAALYASELISKAMIDQHPYLTAKGFPEMRGLVKEGLLLIPVRDCRDYQRVIAIQQIAADGEKRFLTGSRTRYGIHRLGSSHPKRTLLCEGYATALSIDMAMMRLPGPHAVIACFSANNLELVAKEFTEAYICADNDKSQVGQRVAEGTGHRWAMPPFMGTDFNDMHQQHGLYAVVEVLRNLLVKESMLVA